MYRFIVFDLDGTLLDTLGDLAAAGNHTLSAMGLPTHPVDAYRKMVGNGIPKLIERMLPQHNRGQATQQLASELFDNYYSQHMQDLTAPYPGIIELLKNISAAGVILSIASNKADEYAQVIVNDYFNGFFKAVAGLKPEVPAKPEPHSVYNLLEELGAEKSETLYVGDSNVDMLTAKNAGLKACGVLWGFRDREELLEAGADFIVEDTLQLASLILS